MTTVATWTANPHQTVPAQLATHLRALRGSRACRGQASPLGAALAACRDKDWGVPALAAAVGMTPDAIAQQIFRARRSGSTAVPDGLTIPAPELTAEEHPGRSITGGPNPELPATIVAHLRGLHADHGRVRGHMPADHPCRIASAHLAEDIALLLNTYRKCRIKAALGVSYRAVDQLLERQGHRPPVPSALRRSDFILAAGVADQI